MLDAARDASFKDEVDACVFVIGVAATERLVSCGECFAFEVGSSFIRFPSSG